MQEIVSQTADSIEEEFTGKFCMNCSHLISEHYILIGTTKCEALDFNGSVYSACRCTKIKKEFIIKAEL